MRQPRPAQARGTPEWELSDKQSGAIRYLEHGAPHWRIRWHCHDEYELHLIVATTGKMFVGDYVGNYAPGCLVLTGPRLPHNWVNSTAQGESYALRDRVVHFDHEVMVSAASMLPELQALLPLLEQAKHGIEFFGQAETAERLMVRIKESTGASRLGHFCELMDELVRSANHRLLSTAQIRLPADEALQTKIDRVVNYVLEHYQDRIALAQVAALVGMSEDYFSRFFRKATGNCLSDFINRIRISKACDLLSRTDTQITTICCDVGFNNVANFNRRFRQYKKMTPSNYRKQIRERDTAYRLRLRPPTGNEALGRRKD